MPRTKGGVVSRRRRNRILKLAKGYFGSKHTLFKTAKEQVMHSLKYALSASDNFSTVTTAIRSVSKIGQVFK